MCPCCPRCHCQDVFGSVVEPMGGIAGRPDAMFGAVESQKTTGALHYHFFLFIQRLHQYATMKEIARQLEEAMVNAQELKDFLSAICCERYANIDQFQKERSALERNFPTYAEEANSEGKATWGDHQLGRLPAFIYKDAERTTRSLPRDGALEVPRSAQNNRPWVNRRVGG